MGVGAVWALALGLSASPQSPAWLTRAERTGFQETSRYEETLEDCRRLERGSPWIKVTSFGTSPEGRSLILVVASKDRAFDPRSARRTGKPILLLQAGIHAGEIDGKDAGLMLLRDITTGAERGLLDHAIVLFMPIYNVDGHERFGPYHRINQNGPREMGWRTTSRNLNLNRDYVKADAAETRAWLGVFTTWWPDLTLDAHVTDGADYQYDVTYAYEAGENVPRPVADWITRAVEERVLPELRAGGHKTSPYVFLHDDTNPAAGIAAFPPTPRFSNAYTPLQNRPAFLIETHMLKDYRTRVVATYDVVRAFLRELNREPGALRRAVERADAEAARPGQVALAFRVVPKTIEETFQGIAFRRELSEVSGGTRIVYGKEPVELRIARTAGLEVSVRVDKPIAYLVPPQWTEAIERLRAHGLALRRLASPATVEVEGYRLTSPVWQSHPFEGRHPVSFKTERLPPASRTFPAGSIVVRMDQRSSAVAAHLLEPMGPDSLAAWGFFDALFEQKEYAEAYVLESLAREMLEKDPSLRAAFEKELADPAFAGSPSRRLDFFYRRSPWWDDRMGLYPIGLLTSPADLPTEAIPSWEGNQPRVPSY
ncbi:MAG TPA: M14 family metallopeptidase [Candidatus Polarisedimenticolia bacterium]|nr:M14 family metallopeptidase [Candidatus Polarisedimenticolia bacterium]